MLIVIAIASYVRTEGTDVWLIIRLKKITGDFFQTLEVNAVYFVIKWGQIPLPKCKHLGFYEN